MLDTPGNSEKELIRNCIKGDILSQERLYKHFYGYAMGVGLRYIFNREDALEVVNDGFIKAFHSIGSFNKDHAFKPWLRKIIVNTAIDRRRKDMKHLQEVDLEHADHVHTQAHIVERLSAQDILKLLDFLPDIQRMVFNLYEIDGYTHEEVAEALNIPASSSRTYLSRAKDKLRKALVLQDQNSYERVGR
ncbi:MAG TPA: RNA polymerase sigma factor [Sphingobacteriaceae bacterium]|nr:RNA polymerase sigma factor [Sphingobacteriaceae bacterium]